MKPSNVIFWLLALSLIILFGVTMMAIYKEINLSELSEFYSIIGIFIGLFGGGLIGTVLGESYSKEQQKGKKKK